MPPFGRVPRRGRGRALGLTLALSTMLTAPGWCQNSSPALLGRPIAAIRFDPADQPYTAGELQDLVVLKPGDVLRSDELRTAIQRLFATGRYADIAVDGEPDGSGVTLTFQTKPNYFVSGVNIDGEAEPPNRNQLITATNLDLGELFRSDQMSGATDRIQERLRANGLYQSTVEERVETTAMTGEANIFFDLQSGDRAHFGGVELDGDFDQSQSKLIRSTEWKRSLGPLPLPGWRELTEQRLQTGIDNLRRDLQKNDRLQASVTLDRLEYDKESNRVTPHLKIESGPKIEVRTEGYKLGSNRLRELLPIYQERSVDRGLLVEGQNNLTEYLQAQGYFDAQVAFSQSSPDPGRSVIEYMIDRGEKHTLANIEIAGNHYFDALTLRERMRIQSATRLRWRNGRYSPRLLDQDVASIKGLYQNNGFREVSVVPYITEDYLGRHTDLAVRIQIDEGRQWFVNQLRIDGVSDEDREYFEGVLRSTAGQPFSESAVTADRDAILTYYYNDGYTNAIFDWQAEPGPAENLMNVRYLVDAGQREYVRGVLVRGLKKTNPELVDSRIVLQPGDPISQNRIGESQQKLYELGIFSKVQTAIQNPEGDEPSKYVLFHMDEARKYSFNFGVGAQLGRIGGGTTTFNAPAGAYGFAPRASIGVSRINFLGLGHTVGLQTLISTRQRRALLNYLAPQFKGHENLQLSISGLFNDARDVRTFSARTWETSFQLSQRFTRAVTVQARYSFRRVTLDENSLQISPDLIPLLARPVRVGLMAFSVFQDRRDDPVDSHRGIFNSIDFGVASKAFGSQSDFSRVLVRNSTYHPLGREMVLARTVQFGYIQRLGGLSEIPLAERFFAGGASSNRAFPDNQAGPRDLNTGFPLGGQALLMFQTELRFPLIGDAIGGVLFHDMGNVFSEINAITFRATQHGLQDFNYMVHGAGFGMRYRTPVGPLRIDLSYGPNSPRFFGFAGTRDQLLAGQGTLVDQRINRFQIHFSLGQTF